MCEGQGPKGRAELHFAGIEVKETDGTIGNDVLTVAVPEGVGDYDTSFAEKLAKQLKSQALRARPRYGAYLATKTS